jgi:hypothetical protein
LHTAVFPRPPFLASLAIRRRAILAGHHRDTKGDAGPAITDQWQAVRLDPKPSRWYDPRDGTWRAAGEHANTGVRAFAAPTQGPQSDWLLVLDDAAKGYPIR